MTAPSTGGTGGRGHHPWGLTAVSAAVFAGLVTSGIWLIGGQVLKSGRQEPPGAAATSPTIVSPVPGVTPITTTPSAEPRRTSSRPTTKKSTAPPTVPNTSKPVVATAPRGVCDRAVTYKGQVFPRVDTSYAGEPLNVPATIGFKSAGRGPSTVISVIDQTCRALRLFVVQAGRTRSADLFTGQTVLVETGSDGSVGSFIVSAGFSGQPVDLE
jgi:hypothetical protein